MSLFGQKNKEEWKPIQGFNNYLVSNHGRVKNIKRGNVLKPRPNPSGRMQIQLYRDGAGKNYSLHRVVAKSFISNPENKPQVNHKDGDPSNNHASNLEWCTQSENMIHAYKNGLNHFSEKQRKEVSKAKRGENHHNSKLSKRDVLKIRRLSESGDYTQDEIAQQYSVDQSIVSRIKSRQYWGYLQ